MMWFYFGVVCMVKDPADCTRVVFDIPRGVAAVAYGTVKRQPPSFRTLEECLLGMKGELNGAVPLKVMGSEWTEIGCTREQVLK